MIVSQDNREQYRRETEFIYGTQSWGPLYAQADGGLIENTDNNARKYVLESLKIMKIDEAQLKDKVVFNIGTGREARVFWELGAKFVTHFDISGDSVKNVREFIKGNNIKNFESIHGDIQKTSLEKNKYDIIFLAGIYQHIEVPAIALVNLMNMLKPGGIMYMGFYRSGEWKYFIVDAIRYLLDKDMFVQVKRANNILYTGCQAKHYQMARLIDDFFVPVMHKFHPKDVVDDIKLLGGEIFYFDNYYREYNHEGKDHFSIGGDRIYITKKQSTVIKLEDVICQMKTKTGRNQILDMEYQEEIIKDNISLIKNIENYKNFGFISTMDIVLLCLQLYQLTRPFIPEQSEFYQKSICYGRHKTLNEYLNNFIKVCVHD